MIQLTKATADKLKDLCALIDKAAFNLECADLTKDEEYKLNELLKASYDLKFHLVINYCE